MSCLPGASEGQQVPQGTRSNLHPEGDPLCPPMGTPPSPAPPPSLPPLPPPPFRPPPFPVPSPPHLPRGTPLWPLSAAPWPRVSSAPLQTIPRVSPALLAREATTDSVTRDPLCTQGTRAPARPTASYPHSHCPYPVTPSGPRPPAAPPQAPDTSVPAAPHWPLASGSLSPGGLGRGGGPCPTVAHRSRSLPTAEPWAPH